MSPAASIAPIAPGDWHLGHAAMDRLHEEFLALAQARGQAVLTVLDALALAAREHFGAEEQWMVDSAFPARGCHVDEHAAVLRSIEGVQRRVARADFDAARADRPAPPHRCLRHTAPGSRSLKVHSPHRRPPMLSPQDNQLLCRVEGDAAMGRLMRAHWLPVCLVEEVGEPDGAPVQARVLGEDLVVFRDSNGRVGVLAEACPHRGPSLALGRNEESGLRCLYHGWKMDVDGNVLEMTSEPPASGLAQKTRHRAYPVKEWGALVWAWFGAPDGAARFCPPAWAPSLEVRVSIAKVVLPCNWAQVLEGAIDSAHSSSLHASDMLPARVDGAQATGKAWLRPSTDKAPRLQVERCGYGFRYAALRRPIQNAAANDYVRATVFVAPATVLIPPNDRYNVANVNVPIDDTHTAFYFIAWGHLAQTPETATWRSYLYQSVGVDLDARYRPLRNADNRFWQDRQAMKAGNFTGISGFPNQDVAMWLSMGPIADRSRERLGASDLAIVEFRRQMIDAARAVGRGEAAIGSADQAAPVDLCAFQAIVPKTTDWRSYPARPTWLESQAHPQTEPS